MRTPPVEGAPQTARFIRAGLEEVGHVVDHTTSGRKGFVLAMDGSYDALTIDIILLSAAT